MSAAMRDRSGSTTRRRFDSALLRGRSSASSRQTTIRRRLAERPPSGDTHRMECQECGEESDELVRVTVEGKARKLCPDCHELFEEQQEIAAEAGAAMRGMMEYKGK
jgi:hypothetical protein